MALTIVDVYMITVWMWSCCSLVFIDMVGLWATEHFATFETRWQYMAYKTQKPNVAMPYERFAPTLRNPPLLGR